MRTGCALYDYVIFSCRGRGTGRFHAVAKWHVGCYFAKGGEAGKRVVMRSLRLVCRVFIFKVTGPSPFGAGSAGAKRPAYPGPPRSPPSRIPRCPGERNTLTQRSPGHQFPDKLSPSMPQALQTWHVKVCPRHRARGDGSWSGVGTAQGRGGVGGRWGRGCGKHSTQGQKRDTRILSPPTSNVMQP
jgi:hypothetical protein